MENLTTVVHNYDEKQTEANIALEIRLSKMGQDMKRIKHGRMKSDSLMRKEPAMSDRQPGRMSMCFQM